MIFNVEMHICKVLLWQSLYALLYFPQMWSMNTQAMKSRDMTRTGTGPT